MSKSEYVAGKTSETGLIAVIRFATDSAALDDGAPAVLTHLYKNFRILLDSTRVTFTCIGFADRRGAFAYNLQLGLNRSNAVKAQIDRVFGYLDNYTGIASYSLGEMLANQAAKSQADLAEDRLVKIYSSMTQLSDPTPTPLPEAVHPSVLRTTYRYFSKSAFENTARPDMSDPKPGINSGIAIAKDAATDDEIAKFEDTWGSEDKTSRVATKIDATFRVNTVVKTLRYRRDVKLSLYAEYWSAEVRYVWGDPPKDYVRVEERKLIDGEERFGATYVARDDADASSLLNPPDP